MGNHAIVYVISKKSCKNSKREGPQRFSQGLSTTYTGIKPERSKGFKGKHKEFDCSISDCVGYTAHLPGMHFII